jgi:hypothetical protein
LSALTNCSLAKSDAGVGAGADKYVGVLVVDVLGLLRALGCIWAVGVSFFPIAHRTANRIRSGTNHDWGFLRMSIALTGLEI